MKLLLIFALSFWIFKKNQGIIELQIGVIVNSDDKITRKVITTAMQLANKDLEKAGYRLIAETETVNENPSFNIIRKGCNLLNKGLVAYISPVDNAPSRHLSSLASKFHIPHLVTKCRYLDTTTGYPIDIRVNPDCDQYANVIYQYISQIENWSSMIIVHADKNCILKFEKLLNQFENRLKMRHWMHHNLNNNKAIMHDMSKEAKHHHILVDLPYWQITDFLIMASVHKMTADDFTFVFSDLNTNLVDLASFKINNKVNITAFSILNSQVVNRYRQKEEEVNQTISSIIEAESSARKADIFPNFLAHSAVIFDSVTLLAKGILKLAKLTSISPKPLSCDQNQTWFHGLSLVNAIKSVDNFNGLTGKIEIDENGLRTNYNVHIYNLDEEGFEQTGVYNDKKINMFPTVKIESLFDNSSYQAPIRVTTIVGPPFVYYRDTTVNTTDYETDISMWDGYAIELLQKIGQDLNLNFSIRLVADGFYGNKIPNETYPDGREKWNGMIKELIEGEADLALAAMTITYERERVVDFTTPYMSLGLSILFKRPNEEAPSLFSFLSPLSPPVWGYVIGAYLGVSLILYFISHLTPYEWLPSHPCDDSSEKENQFNFLNSLWFAVGALVQQGCEIAPQASSTRIISGAWWFFTLIIISTYTANLAAFLTVEMFNMPIKSVEDLAGQTEIKYGTLKSGSSEAFFERAQFKIYKRMNDFMKKHPDVMVDKTQEGVDRVSTAEGKYAFLLENTMGDFYRQRKCDLIKVGDPLDSKGYGIGVPTGSPLRDRLTESILKLQKSQELDALKHKWWNEKNISEPCNTKESGSQPASLNVAQVGGVFVLLGVGFVLAFIISIIELYCVFKKKKLNRKIQFSTYFCKEMQFAMRFMSSSKKPKRPNIENGGYNLQLTTSQILNNNSNKTPAGTRSSSREKLSLLDRRFSSGINMTSIGTVQQPNNAAIITHSRSSSNMIGGGVGRLAGEDSPIKVAPYRNDGLTLRKQKTLDGGGTGNASSAGFDAI